METRWCAVRTVELDLMVDPKVDPRVCLCFFLFRLRSRTRLYLYIYYRIYGYIFFVYFLSPLAATSHILLIVKIAVTSHTVAMSTVLELYCEWRMSGKREKNRHTR